MNIEEADMFRSLAGSIKVEPVIRKINKVED